MFASRSLQRRSSRERERSVEAAKSRDRKGGAKERLELDRNEDTKSRVSSNLSNRSGRVRIRRTTEKKNTQKKDSLDVNKHNDTRSSRADTASHMSADNVKSEAPTSVKPEKRSISTVGNRKSSFAVSASVENNKSATPAGNSNQNRRSSSVGLEPVQEKTTKRKTRSRVDSR